MTDVTHRSSDHPAWGPWRLATDTLCLVAIDPRHGGERYEIDLERSITSAETLDWICQVAGKGWADDETLAGLVRAVNDVLRPQASLCSNGMSKEITSAEVAQLVAKAAGRWPLMVER